MKRTQLLLTLILALLAAITAPRADAAQLHGVVRDETNRPVPHSMVTLRHREIEKAITTFTDAAGAYALEVPDEGLYDLRIRRIGYNVHSETAIQFEHDARLQRDAGLKTLPKKIWVHDLPASDWFARVAFSSSELRGQFAIQCAMCHQQGSLTTRLPRSAEYWHQLFDLMAEFGATMNQELYDEAPRVLNAAYDYANLDLDSFPDHPPTIDENSDPVVITEWDVGQPSAFLHDMAIGPDEIIYTVDWIGDKLYALDPETNELKEWDIPTSGLRPGGILGILAERGRRYLHQTPTVAPHSLQVGPNGKIWITLSIGTGLASFDPATEQFATFDHPKNVMYPHTLRFDDEGGIWYTVSMTNHLAHFSPADERFTVYDLPTRNWTQWFLARGMRLLVWASNTFGLKGRAVVADPEMNPVPYGIDITPDGKVWFSQFNNRRIGNIDPATEEITMLDTPFYGPRRLRTDSKGVLWIPSYAEGRFYRFDPAQGDFKEYQLPTGPGDLAYSLAIDPRDDSVWLCGTNSDSVIHFQPESETFQVHQLPTRVSFTRELEVDEQGNVWTSISNMPYYQIEGGRGKLIRLSFPGEVTQ